MSAQEMVGRRALEVVVCLQDSIVDVIHVRGEGTVRAGSTADCQIPLPAGYLGVGVESVIVARVVGTARPQVIVSLDGAAALRDLADLENTTLVAGPMKIFVRDVADAPAAPRKLFTADRRVLGVLAASFVAHMVFLFVLMAIPPEAHGLSLNAEYRMARNSNAQVKPQEDALAEPERSNNTGETSGTDEGTQAKDGETGLLGDPDKTTKGTIKIKGRSTFSTPGAGTPRDAQHAGLNMVLNGNSFSPVTADGMPIGSYDDNTVGRDGEDGPGGPGQFAGGYDDGNGPGGCKQGMYCGPKTIGRTSYNTPKDPNGRPGRPGEPTLKDPPHKGPVVKISDVRTDDGGLDAEIVRREVRKHRAEISYCYEKQLTVNPELSGNVTVKFTIAPNGLVESASIESSSIGSKEVASCVLAQTRTWKFPPTSNGSRTHVKYPFEFHVSGR